jgi:GH24 family phage-related lysozyme (muramidase)
VKASVLEAWHTFSTPLEGRVRHMYLDILGLVTAGVGNLADPVSLALQMPWVRPDGSPASSEEIRRDWAALKAQPALRKLHYKFAAPHTKVRLTDAGIDAMVRAKLLANESFMRGRYFPDWDQWPADAQLGVCSMAWACGPGFPAEFKNFARFAREQRWLEAMAACKIRETNPDGSPNAGIIPRNRANRLCFANAETVRRGGMDPEILYWPDEAPTKPFPVDREAETDPAIPVFVPDPNIEAVHQQRDADIADLDSEPTHPETPEAKQ